jgi:citrate lyase beta subunit
MIRSLLYVALPAPETLAAAAETEADALLLDLEDSVHRNRKAEVRELIARFVESASFGGKTVLVRVNDVLTQTGQEDIARTVTAGAPFLLLPKVRTQDEIFFAETLIKRAETEASAPVGRTRIWVMIETTDAVLNLKEIGAAPRLAGFVLGAGDLSAELRVRQIGLGADRLIWDFPLEVLYAKQLAVLVARSRGLQVVDSGYTTVRDLDGTRRSALMSAQMGFDGTLAFTPDQLAPIHGEFTPSAEEYDWACRALAAWQQADGRGETKVEVDGQVLASPFLKGARTIKLLYDEASKRSSAAQPTSSESVSQKAAR